MIVQGHHAAAGRPRRPSAPSSRRWPTPDVTRRAASVVDKVVGMEARGFILAAPVALALGVGFVPVRKAGQAARGRRYAETYELEYGEATLEIHATRSPRATGCCWSTTCSPPAAPSRRPPTWSSAAAPSSHGVAVLMELSFLPGREAVGDLPLDRPARPSEAVATSAASAGRRRRLVAVVAKPRAVVAAWHAERATPSRPRVASRRPAPERRRAMRNRRRPGWRASAARGRQPGARAAVPHRAGQPPQGRPGADRAGLRHRRASSTAARCARAATPTSPTRWPSPRSWPTSA